MGHEGFGYENIKNRAFASLQRNLLRPENYKKHADTVKSLPTQERNEHSAELDEK